MNLEEYLSMLQKLAERERQRQIQHDKEHQKPTTDSSDDKSQRSSGFSY